MFTFNGQVTTVEVLYILKIVVSKGSQQKYRSEDVIYLLWIYNNSGIRRELILKYWFIIKL